MNQLQGKAKSVRKASRPIAKLYEWTVQLKGYAKSLKTILRFSKLFNCFFGYNFNADIYLNPQNAKNDTIPTRNWHT